MQSVSDTRNSPSGSGTYDLQHTEGVQYRRPLGAGRCNYFENEIGLPHAARTVG